MQLQSKKTNRMGVCVWSSQCLGRRVLDSLGGHHVTAYIFPSRLIGLYCILIALSMITHRQAIVETVKALLYDPKMMFVLGVITLGAGLAMVLAHNIWSGGALAVIVTLVCWSTLIKGLFFLFLPPHVGMGFFLKELHFDQLFYMYMAIPLVLGIYLAYGGFTLKSHS